MTLASIAAAATATDAQAAYNAVKDEVTATQGEALQMAVDARVKELATMARAAEQKQDLMDAAGMIDTSDLSTQALVDAARTAIAGLRQAIADAVDVDDTSMYQTMLNNAVNAVDDAQGGIDTATRRMRQMTELSDASDDLQAALAALSGATPTQALLDAANNALTALNNAITGGADLTDTEKAPYQHEAANAASPIRMAQTAFDKAEDDKDMADTEDMKKTAMALYDAIGDTPLDATARPTVFDGTTFSVDPDGSGSGDPVSLSEDDDAMAPAPHGWSGKMYDAEQADGDNAGMYEAAVYTNQGDRTPGQPFSTVYSANFSDGVLDTSTTEGTASRVASPEFDQTAGWKRFPLPDPNPGLATRVSIPGTYHGVSGIYRCTPGTGNICAVRKDANNAFTLGAVAEIDGTFTVGNGEWTFMPTNAMARVMGSPDGQYLVYGWWIHKDADDDPAAATAFTANVGTVPPAAGLDALQGTARYMGGAAGKYALRSSTGGTNDAGHFTARATLEANFSTNMVEGIIDDFKGADGQSRKWSVELMESGVGPTGIILGENGSGTAMMTKWTIDEDAGDAGGQWSGNLFDNDDGGVPKVGTGTFSSTYGEAGRMVGAFGVDKQDKQ